MTPPPPRPDDEQPPPADGWEVVEPARDPLLDDPLFAELVENKPLPELRIEPTAAHPVADPVDDLPVAEVMSTARATPVERPRPVAPPPPRRPEEPVEPPRPQVFAACAVLGCFGLGFVLAMGFMGWAALTLLSGLPDDRRGDTSAITRPGPVGPTQFAGPKRAVPLPGRVDAVGRAAGGRYLLMRVTSKREILAFDPNSGELLAHRFECGPAGLFAGSAAKLFLYRSDAAGEELQRWDLATGTREKTAPRPRDVLAPSALVVGAGVDGPLYLVNVPSNGSATVRVFDPDTLEPQGSYAVAGWKSATSPHVRPSDDGNVWGVSADGGAQLLRFQPGAAKAVLSFLPLPRWVRATPVLASSSRDGTQAYCTYGAYDATTTPVKKLGRRSPYAFPPAHGSGLFLSLERDPETKVLSGPLRLHVAADPDGVVDVPNVDVPRGLQYEDAAFLPPDQRIHVWPAAGLAVVIPATTGPGGQPDQQMLEVCRVDVRNILKESQQAHLLYGSEPQLWAVRGREWRYRPVVWTDEDVAPTPNKQDGPMGMTVQGGEVVWTPGSADPRADVTLRVTSGKLTAEQRFRVTVLDDHDGNDD